MFISKVKKIIPSKNVWPYQQKDAPKPQREKKQFSLSNLDELYKLIMSYIKSLKTSQL